MTDTLREQLQDALDAAYTIDRELGGGGMSRVFVARDEALSRDIVVKVLAPELAQEMSAERFAREIKLAAALQEPHIVPLLTAGSMASGVPYYTMPFVRGASLRQRLNEGAVPRDEAVRILRDVALALAYAHDQGVVHRDIKPENILLSSGTAVVTDFGIAKALQLSRTAATDAGVHDGLTHTGTSIGTPAYMAPEQAAGDPTTDQRADIYAWGVVAYELLAGKHPFAGRTSPQQIMAAHFSETPASLGTTATSVATGVSELVMRCLAKDAAKRPASAHELVATLDSALATPTAPTHKRARLALGAAALALLALVAFLWYRTRTPRGDPERPLMIAVLPFEHAGPADQQPFTDGLTDAITAKLGALPSVAVIDRQSASQYRGTSKPAKQIGTELGVQYLVVGVVRWSTDASGSAAARVTPTLVDAVTGVTKWTGEPTLLALNDPFTAQTAIATDVAQRLEIAVTPSDRATLRRNLSDNPEALAAFYRAIGIRNEAARRLQDNDPIVINRYASALEIAVKLDTTFGDAWAALLAARRRLASLAPEDSNAAARLERTLTTAITVAPDNPYILLNRALTITDDSAASQALVERALREGSKNADILLGAGNILLQRGLTDSAYRLAKRGHALNPRSVYTTDRMIYAAYNARQWDDAFTYASTLIDLDSTDQRGWFARMSLHLLRGDTSAVRQDFATSMRIIPGASALSRYMPFGGDAYRTRFLNSSMNDLEIISLLDSANSYFDSKISVAVALRDSVRARVYADSLCQLLENRSLSGPDEALLLVILAGAQSIAGKLDASRRSIGQAMTIARRSSTLEYPSDALPGAGAMVASVYARLGDFDTAVRWLEADLPVYLSVRGLLLEPRLDVLKGTPQFEQFLKAHPP